jgi:TolB protein
MRSKTLFWVNLFLASVSCGRGASESPPSLGTAEDEARAVIDLSPGDRARTTADLNLRSGPGRSRHVLTVLPSGTELVVGERSGVWYAVDHDGTSGWVSGAYLEKIEDGGEDGAGEGGGAGGNGGTTGSGGTSGTGGVSHGSPGPLAVPLSGSIQNPCWSPDGTRLAFTRFVRGYNSAPAIVEVIDPAGGAPEVVSATGAESVNLPGSCWSRGGSITFSSDVNGHDEIFLAAPGQAPVQVTHRSGHVAYEPSLSPDERWVVFESHVEDVEDGGSIWKVRTDGTGLTRLTSGTGDDRQPNWSPAGDRILFQSLRSGNWDIWTMDPDGGSLLSVTDASAQDTDASWSPDGASIVYSSDQGGLDNATLFVISKDGGSPRRVTTRRGYAGAPSWSPDGRLIAFETSPGDPDGSSGTSISIVAAP